MSKKYERWLAAQEVIATTKRALFLLDHGVVM